MNRHNIKIFLANARSVKGKVNELKVLSTQCDIMCLTETHLDSSIHNSTILEANDKIIHRNDRNIHGGGVIIALQTEIVHERVFVDLPCILEYVAVVFESNKCNVLLICIYNPPVKHCADELQLLLDHFMGKYPKYILMLTGDFNMPDINWSLHSVKKESQSKGIHTNFLNVIQEFNLSQLINEPTHIRGNILDLVLCTHPSFINNTNVVEPGLSDHYIIEFEFKAQYNTQKPQEKIIKLYNKANQDQIRKSLESINDTVGKLIAECSPIDAVWKTFTRNLQICIEQHVPVKKIRPRNSHEPIWFNRSARKAVSKQRRLYNNYRKSKDIELFQKYKTLRRGNKKAFRKLELGYLSKNLYEPMRNGNTKAFFRYVKYQTQEPKTLDKLVDSSGNVVVDKNEMADLLNTFFKSVFSDTGDNYPEVKPKGKGLYIDENGVRKLIKDLKNGKAPGPDGIRKNDLTIDLDLMSTILTRIFQYSIDTCKIPNIWKTANVVPVFKAGDKGLATNYRPVSLTSICCKTLEHIVASSMGERLENILNFNQHGFRKGLSCSTQLAITVNDILATVDNNLSVQAVVLDFAKAFDKVPHDKLLQKLVKYEFEDGIIKWIEAFLCGRSQKVVLDGSCSGELPVTSGVPQGSVLGPILFLVYINDIFNSIRFSTLRLYADDALLYINVNEQDNLNFQQDLDGLTQWATENGMFFNTNKCYSIIFGKAQSADRILNHRVSGKVLERIDSFKYLGVTITNNFNWDTHINNITSKANRCLGLLRHVLYKTPEKIKLTAYKTLVRSTLEHASEVWDPFLRKEVDQLERVQNRAVRFIGQLRGKCSVSAKRDQLKLETLENRRSGQRKRLLNNILFNQDSHPAIRASFPLPNASSFAPIHTTRSITSSIPSAFTCNKTQYLQSFLPRTSRELRVNNIHFLNHQ